MLPGFMLLCFMLRSASLCDVNERAVLPNFFEQGDQMPGSQQAAAVEVCFQVEQLFYHPQTVEAH